MRVRLGYDEDEYGIFRSYKVCLKENNRGLTLPSNIGELGDITELDLSHCSLRGTCAV